MNTIRSIAPDFRAFMQRQFGRLGVRQPYQPDAPMLEGTLIESWRKRLRYRWHLRRIIRCEPERLADIGLTLKEAKSEVRKPFWRSHPATGIDHDARNSQEERSRSDQRMSFHPSASTVPTDVLQATQRTTGIGSYFDRPTVL